jgi:hypothetical protein
VPFVITVTVHDCVHEQLLYWYVGAWINWVCEELVLMCRCFDGLMGWCVDDCVDDCVDALTITLMACDV